MTALLIAIGIIIAYLMQSTWAGIGITLITIARAFKFLSHDPHSP